MQFITRPLTNWNRPATANRTRANYVVGYAKTLDELERELRHLKVTGDVVIEIDLQDTDIRRDGLPYSDKNPRSPRVVLAFTGKHGAMIYRCDVHQDWKHNLRAIALGLQRLRLVAETGITAAGEQYTGFRALPPGIQMPAMTVEDAARVVASSAAPMIEKLTDPLLRDRARNYGAHGVIAGKEVFQELYRLAARISHPDAGGTDDAWHQLQAAAEILKKHHQLA